MIDFSFPENSDPGDRDEERRRIPEPPPRSSWRADLLILLAAALAAVGTFLYEAWQRTHPETMV